MPVRSPGSSPLTRGALTSSSGVLTWNRLIPAHAGSTNSQSGCLNLRRAHPRSRGEHDLLERGRLLSEGSSPLTRGARMWGCLTRGVNGLIPAHAGSTLRSVLALLPERAHPRSRGEHPYTVYPESNEKGSSPLTRGALTVPVTVAPTSGLIPAHAGSTPSLSSPRVGTRAHPRSRGEHHAQGLIRPTGRGSSPLTRGAPATLVSGDGVVGLIPAHAGSTDQGR